jgi:hypothetical protein
LNVKRLLALAFSLALVGGMTVALVGCTETTKKSSSTTTGTSTGTGTGTK